MMFPPNSRLIRAGLVVLALLSLIPPVGFGFCATSAGHLEFRFFDSVSVECCTTATPPRGAGECDPPACASCDDVTMTLQTAIRTAHHDLVAPDGSTTVPMLQVPAAHSVQRFVPHVLADLRRDVKAPPLDTTLLRP